MKRTAAVGVIGTALCALVAAGCGSGGASSLPAGPAAVSVVATSTQTADFVRVIGGANVTVYSVLKPNVDPHEFEPAPGDIEALRKAKVIVSNGLGLEPWLAGAQDAANPKGMKVVATDGVTARHENGGTDPHAWQNPRNAIIMVTNIADALERVDPAHAQQYRANLTSYTEEINALDAETAARIAALPNKKLVTNHDAFGYYIDRYGLQFVGSVIPSMDTAAEPSAADLRRLVTNIKAEGVHAVFAENSLPAKVAQAIATEAGVKVVDGPDSLYGDSLGPIGSPAGTYLQMIRHNTDVIVKNLS